MRHSLVCSFSLCLISCGPDIDATPSADAADLLLSDAGPDGATTPDSGAEDAAAAPDSMARDADADTADAATTRSAAPTQFDGRPFAEWLALHCAEALQPLGSIVRATNNGPECPTEPPFRSLEDAESRGCTRRGSGALGTADDGVDLFASLEENSVNCRSSATLSCVGTTWSWTSPKVDILGSSTWLNGGRCNYNGVGQPFPSQQPGVAGPLRAACVDGIEWNLGEPKRVNGAPASCPQTAPFRSAADALARDCKPVAFDAGDSYREQDGNGLYVQAYLYNDRIECTVQHKFDCAGAVWYLNSSARPEPWTYSVIAYGERTRRVSVQAKDSASCRFEVQAAP